jgi:ATP-dependent exoDNAse (exonuclease V) alpha subunit
MSEAKQKNLVPVELNEGQRDAYKQLINFIESHGRDMFLLEGFAGTGKSYLIGKVISWVIDKYPHWNVGMTAPTNKAVKVLMRAGRAGNRRVKYQTIHKLLGLKEEITADGRQIFTKDKYEDSSIEEYNIIVVDEVSMLNDELFEEIQQHSGHVKIIFMGDPAQIPPVGKDDCIPFKEAERAKYGIKHHLLTEIMRQAKGNPIVEAGFAIRSDLNSYDAPVKQTHVDAGGHGVVLVDFSMSDNLIGLIDEYFACNEFSKNADHAKFIAWRNATVSKLNKVVRERIYKSNKLDKIMIGEKLVANKPITDKYKVTLFTTNDEFEVIDYDILSRMYATDGEAMRLSYYHATVEYFDLMGQRQRRKIDILHEESEEDFNRVLADMKSAALKSKGMDAKKAWVRYYEFMRTFADVVYNYAITCHKCQGSTYNNVFILENDIDMNSNIFERNRIKYTAYSRPSERLFVIKK